MSLLDKASLIVTPNGFKASKLYSVIPSDGSGDLDVTRATTATRVNSLSLIESVANNVPRLDYVNSACPSLLVEPQRTNKVIYSEQFDNAAWDKLNVTVTANNAISPDGTQNADKIDFTNNDNYLITFGTNAQTTSYTVSCYAKKGTTDIFLFREAFYFGSSAKFNLTNGTIVTDSTGTAKITSVGNGWYRCSMTQAYTSGQTNMQWSYDTYLNTGNLYLWGAQIEAGSYATSYIPTTSASVTRNTDVISKTGISSLIGQTEGVIFTEMSALSNDGTSRDICLQKDTLTGNRIILKFNDPSNSIQVFLQVNGAIQVNFTKVITNTLVQNKFAFSYKTSGASLWVNGVKEYQSGSISTFAIDTLNKISFTDGVDGENLFARVNQLQLYKTALTETELATLTTL
jgi:hypothetical protein